MTRILWLTEHYPPSRGGMAESCDRIVRGLRNAGAEIDVAHLTRRDRPWSVEREHGGRLLTAPLDTDPEHALRRLWTTLTAEGLADAYTHVVAFGGTYGMLAAPVLSAFLQAPLVTLLRGNDLDIGLFSMRRRATLLEALRASARVCVVARSHAPMVSALVETPVTWVPNSVDMTTWQILPSERDRARQWRAANVTPDRRTIGIIGQLKNKKGVGFLLDALDASGHAGAFHLLLVGEVEETVTTWLAGSEVHHTFLPFLERYELPAIYASCDLVALPSFYDGMPNVSLEAAALGIPLLASDAGGLADVADDEIGFVFPAGDRHACRAAIDRAARATDDELAKLGAAARERIRHDFTPAAETTGYLRVFDEVRK